MRRSNILCSSMLIHHQKVRNAWRASEIMITYMSISDLKLAKRKSVQCEKCNSVPKRYTLPTKLPWLDFPWLYCKGGFVQSDPNHSKHTLVAQEINAFAAQIRLNFGCNKSSTSCHDLQINHVCCIWTKLWSLHFKERLYVASRFCNSSALKVYFVHKNKFNVHFKKSFKEKF